MSVSKPEKKNFPKQPRILIMRQRMVNSSAGPKPAHADLQQIKFECSGLEEKLSNSFKSNVTREEKL